MPAKSVAQQRLMQAAEHGADFPAARKIRGSMTHQQMHDFAVGSEKGKPEHVAKARTKKPNAMSPLATHAAAYGTMEHAAVHPGKNLRGYIHPKRSR